MKERIASVDGVGAGEGVGDVVLFRDRALVVLGSENQHVRLRHDVSDYEATAVRDTHTIRVGRDERAAPEPADRGIGDVYLKLRDGVLLGLVVHLGGYYDNVGNLSVNGRGALDLDGGELSDNNILLGVVGVHVLALHTDEMLTG